jgi:hypothetical protein
MTIAFSRRLAVILGVGAPLAETIRRWHQLGQISVLPCRSRLQYRARKQAAD